MPINVNSDMGEMPFRIQVQIVTFNSEECIDRCIQSVLQQSYPATSCLVIDNASSDSTISIIEAYSNILVVSLERNVGYAAAHNLGFSQAVQDGVDLVLTLNPDVELDSKYLERCIRVFCDDTVGGVIGKLIRSRTLNTNTAILDSTGLVKGSLYHAKDRGSGEADMSQYDRLRNVWGICGASAFYRVDMLKDIAAPHGRALEESFFVYKEDVELCWRANDRGWRFKYEPEAIAYHDRGWKPRESPFSRLASEHSLANQFAILIRHGSAFSLVLWLSIVVESVRLGVMALKHPSSAKIVLSLITSQFRHHVTFRREWKKSGRMSKERHHDLDRYCHL